MRRSSVALPVTRKSNSSFATHLYPWGLVTAAVASKSTDCYLNLLYTMEDVAVYGYITPLKVKIIIVLALTDSVVRDADILTVRPTPISPWPLLAHILARHADIPSAAHGIPPRSCQPLPETQLCN